VAIRRADVDDIADHGPIVAAGTVILVGVSISVPAIAGDTIYSYRIFRGKTGELEHA